MKLFSVLPLLLTVLLGGCANKFENNANNSASVTAAKSGKQKLRIGADLMNWNKKQKITLLPHQLIPIDYLEKNPQQKGLLAYHYLGTGKTYLALGFAERNPGKEIVLFIPRFLKGHWIDNLASYGVANPKRYTIVSHRQAKKLLAMDLSNKIVIIDEAHRILKKLNGNRGDESIIYSKVYLKIQKASRVLSLTGTPLYSHPTDLSYQINLLSDKTLLPFNKEEFKVNYMDIKRHKSMVIGHFLQSSLPAGLIAAPTAAFCATYASTLSASLMVFSLGAFTIGPALLLGKFFFKPADTSLRSFNIEKLDKITKNYISYYDFSSKNNKYYPSKTIHYQKIRYTPYQLSFLLSYADNQLENAQLKQLLRDYDHINSTNDYVNLNSTLIQESLKNIPESGLEIGNLVNRNANNKIVFPQKFHLALRKIKQTKLPVMVYSHFYYNGILLFKKFLDAKGYKGKYRILRPDDSVKQYQETISAYNNGHVKLLLVHPEITEGISLKGTGQLHILETPFNKSLQEQVIGRAVRYKSHMHLPASLRHVNVYIWMPHFSMTDLEAASALRKNWVRNFGEMNYYGERSQIDRNNNKKSMTPDQVAFNNMKQLNRDVIALEQLLKTYSLDSKYKG